MFCPFCGKEIADSSKFCPMCGRTLIENSPVQQEKGRSERRDTYHQQNAYHERNAYHQQNDHGYRNQGGDPSGGGYTKLIIILAAVAAAIVLFLLFGLPIIRDGGSGTGTASASSAASVSASDSGSMSAAQASSGSEGSSPGSGASSQGAVPAEPAKPVGFDAISSYIASKTQGIFNFVSSDVSDYPTVRLYYSCNDSAGNPITLTSPDGAVKETISGGQEIERTVRSIQRLEGNQGLSIDIVADKSGSMSGDLWEMQNIMTQFVQSLDYASGDQAEIISFDSFIMYMCTYTQDAALLTNGISNMTAYGDTALYDALITGINNAGNQAGARCVIGFTDGADNMSMHTPEEVIRLAQEKEVPVYIIGTGGADRSTLEWITGQTNGYYWGVDAISDMNEVIRQIYSTQKDMYCIEYESDASADPYASRTVSCVLYDDIYGAGSYGIPFTATRAIEQTTHTSRYEIIKGDVTWTEANDACIAKGGHLATITTQAEMDQLSQMAADAGVKYVWIGGYTSVRDNNAFGHWITGEPFDYTAWFPGEPSRNDKDGTPEFYLMLWNVQGAWSWNDQRNDVVNSGLDYFRGNVGYICEYEQ